MVNVSSLRPGDKMKVVANGAGHGSPMGTVLTYKGPSGNNIAVNETTWVYFPADLEAAPATREALEERIRNAQARILTAQVDIETDRARLAYMDEVGGDSFNENEFKAYQTLRLLDQSGLSTLQRAKAIAGLFK